MYVFLYFSEVLNEGNSTLDKIGNILKIFGLAILCFVAFLILYCGFVSVMMYCCSSKRIGRIFVKKSESSTPETNGRGLRNQAATISENDSLTVNMSDENISAISQPPPCYEDAIKYYTRDMETAPPSYSESLILNQTVEL